MNNFDDLMKRLESIELSTPEDYHQAISEVLHYLENRESLTMDQMMDLQCKSIRMILRVGIR